MLRQSGLNEDSGRPSTFQGNTASNSSARMVAAKRKEFESTAALEQNSLKLKETFIAFRKQMQGAEQGAEGLFKLARRGSEGSHRRKRLMF